MKRKKKEKPSSGYELGARLLGNLDAMIMADPRLTDEEKTEIIRLSELPDELYEPLEIEGEPLSETIIKMRGSRP
jgi:hypothetical protein